MFFHRIQADRIFHKDTKKSHCCPIKRIRQQKKRHEEGELREPETPARESLRGRKSGADCLQKPGTTTHKKAAPKTGARPCPRTALQPPGVVLSEERQQNTRGDGRADHTGHVGTHGVHQQVVRTVLLLAFGLRYAGSHRNCRNACRADQRVDLVALLAGRRSSTWQAAGRRP